MPNITSFKSEEDYREWYRNYRSNNREKLREYNKNYLRRWRSENGMENDRIRSKLRSAIRNGSIMRGKCEVCGEDNAEGHHFDYSKPLDVIWLCPIHHKQYHKMIKSDLSTGNLKKPLTY